MSSTKTWLITMGPEDRDAILSALRLYQQECVDMIGREGDDTKEGKTWITRKHHAHRMLMLLGTRQPIGIIKPQQ